MLIDTLLWITFAVSSAFAVLSWCRYFGARRKARESSRVMRDAQLRFYWGMGVRGVPLSVVRQADHLLDDGCPDEAHALLKEHMPD